MTTAPGSPFSITVAEESVVHAWYDRFFRPIVEHPNVEEIAINRARKLENTLDLAPTIIFVKHRGGGGWVPYKSEIDLKTIGLFLKMVANYKTVPYDEDRRPALFETLPNGARLSAVFGSNIRYEIDAAGGVALCIRQHGQSRYDPDAPFPLERIELPEMIDPDAHGPLYPELEQMVEEIKACRRGVAFVGMPGSGKTTALKRVLARLPSTWRYFYTEDTRELPPTHPNSVHTYVPRTSTNEEGEWKMVLNFATRSTADALIVGEISPIIADQLPSLINIGYQCCMLSLHAPDDTEAVARLYGLMRQGGAAPDWDSYRRLLTQAVEYFVVLSKDPDTNRRWVSSIRKTAAVFDDLPPARPA